MKISFGVISVIVGIVIVSLAVNQESNATFAGENGKISFVRVLSNNFDIFTIEPDGSGEKRLTTHPKLDSNPEWSSDGKKIVFDSERGASLPDIWVMNSDGTGKTNLTNHPGLDKRPSWSPDGTQIAFMSWRTGCCNIFIMNADGTGQTQLTHFSGTADNPSWSPDGSKIAFEGATGGAGTDIFVINVDGTNLTRLTSLVQDFNGNPDWSPDGSKIVFRSNISSLGSDDIWVMNSDGSGKTRLTNTPTVEIGPAWSPDGKKITFMEWDRITGIQDIFIMNADGTDKKNISNTSGFSEFAPNWQPLLNNPPICEDVAPKTTNSVSSFSSGVVITLSNSTPVLKLESSPSHKIVEIGLSGVTDPDGDPTTLTIDGITQDEPTTGSGKGDKSPDGFGIGTDSALVRAERLGTGDGRVYEISFTADDGNGGMCSGSVFVAVPHDNKKDPIDSGQNFDSTLP